MREKSMDQKLQDFLDGDLEPELCEELVAKMKEDPALFHSYCKHAALDAALESLITQPATKRGGQDVIEFARRRASARSKMVAVAVAAFGLLVTGIVLQVIMVEPPVATIRSSPGTKFSVSYDEGADVPGKGLLGVGGRVTLTQGVFELGFQSGVEAVVKAPAEFRLADDDLVELLEGEIWAKVPEAGRGFRVHTPDLEVVDLGTEFAVRSLQEKADEVHVFSGLVTVRTKGREVDPAEVRAGFAWAGEAEGELVEIPVENGFVTQLPSNQPFLHWSFDGNTPFDVKGTHSLVDGIQSEPIQRDGRAAKDRLVEGRQGQALFFNGKGDSLNTDWGGFMGKTPRTFACWVKLFPNDPQGWGMIAEWGWYGGIYQNSANSRWRVRASEDGHLRISYGKNFFDGDALINDGEWHHIAVADPIHQDASGKPSVRLYVDGHLQTLSHFPEGKSIGSISTRAGFPLVFGKRLPGISSQFHGAIDEVFLFENALSEEQIQRLMETGKP